MDISVSEMKKIVEDNAICKNIDMIFPVVANDLCFVPFFAEPITEFYKANKFELYEIAKNSPFYNYKIFGDKRLFSEITMRRIFAVLLISKERDDARELFISLFKECPKTKTLAQHIEDGNIKGCESILEDALRTYENIDRNLIVSTCLCYTYFFYGDISNNEFAETLFKYVYGHTFSRFMDCTNVTKQQVDSTKVHDKMKVVRECRKAFEYINSGEQLLELLDIGDGWFNPAVQQKLSENHLTIDKVVKTAPAYKAMLYSNYPPVVNDIQAAMVIISSLSQIMEYNDLSLTTYIQDIKLSTEDKDAITRLVANIYSPYGADVLSLDYLVMVSCIYLFAKVFKETREFYMTNNSETEFFELKKYIDENDLLKKCLAELEDKNNAVLSENEKLNDIISELKKSKNDTHEDLLKPYVEEIELLKAKVSTLRDTLAKKEQDSQELYRLRELAFDLKQGDYIPESKRELSELLNGKKVILVGGHINLRKKLSEKYSELVVLDGHNASVNETVFANADLVLFNTSNMSHTVYYKIIDILRTKGIKFDYIGRVINPELLETELVRIVEKQLSN
jgi:hypothetical protein